MPNVSEYVMNDYQNAEENAKPDMLEVHTSDLKFSFRSAIHYRNSMFRRLLEYDINDDETDNERTYFEEFSD